MFLLQMSFEVLKSGLQANLGTIYSMVDMAGIKSIPLNVSIAIKFLCIIDSFCLYVCCYSCYLLLSSPLSYCYS